jgi:cytochrome P450
VELLQKVVDEDFAGFDFFPEWVPTRKHRERKESKSILGETISRILAKRRAEAVNGELADHGDLLSMILAARDENNQPLDDENVRSELLAVFLAGHETTSNALSWMWYLLAKHPDVEAKLHGEIDQVLEGRLPTMADLPHLRYTLQVVKESIRLYPPAWALFGREPSEDVDLGGYRIEKGTHIIISPYFIHRRAESFPDPERFDPERFTPEREAQLPKYAYMPFAAGPHVCIGNQFALMEAQLLTATIAQRFTLRLAPDAQVAMNPRVTLGLTHGLPMVIRERRLAGDQSAKPAATPMETELALA